VWRLKKTVQTLSFSNCSLSKKKCVMKITLRISHKVVRILALSHIIRVLLLASSVLSHSLTPLSDTLRCALTHSSLSLSDTQQTNTPRIPKHVIHARTLDSPHSLTLSLLSLSLSIQSEGRNSRRLTHSNSVLSIFYILSTVSRSFSSYQ